jgi:hypothetical protein
MLSWDIFLDDGISSYPSLNLAMKDMADVVMGHRGARGRCGVVRWRERRRSCRQATDGARGGGSRGGGGEPRQRGCELSPDGRALVLAD